MQRPLVRIAAPTKCEAEDDEPGQGASQRDERDFGRRRVSPSEERQTTSETLEGRQGCFEECERCVRIS